MNLSSRFFFNIYSYVLALCPRSFVQIGSVVSEISAFEEMRFLLDSDNPGHKFLPNRFSSESVLNKKRCLALPDPPPPPSQCWICSLATSELIQHWEGGGGSVGGRGGSGGGETTILELINCYAGSGWVIITIFFLHIPMCVGNMPKKFHVDWFSGLFNMNFAIRRYDVLK